MRAVYLMLIVITKNIMTSTVNYHCPRRQLNNKYKENRPKDAFYYSL